MQRTQRWAGGVGAAYAVLVGVVAVASVDAWSSAAVGTAVAAVLGAGTVGAVAWWRLVELDDSDESTLSRAVLAGVATGVLGSVPVWLAYGVLSPEMGAGVAVLFGVLASIVFAQFTALAGAVVGAVLGVVRSQFE